MPAGQREHLLMCTTGEAVPGQSVRSVLQTPAGQRVWQQCPRRQISFIPAGVPLAWEWSYRSSSVHLALDPALIDDIGGQLSTAGAVETPLEPLFRAEDPVLSRLLHQLVDESALQGPQPLGADLATSSLITLIGVRLHRLARGSERTAESVDVDPSGALGLPVPLRRRTLQLLQDRLAENIPIAELAADTGYSTWHFARLFKQSTGLPPHQYQLRLRIERGCTMLGARPRLSVAAIASDLGFADESHFRRHFKRITGLTPTAWRARQAQ